MFCELLDNAHIIYKYSKKLDLSEAVGKANTINIAKWLRLASQIETVKMNPFRYEEAHLWCESVGDTLDSDAVHHTADHYTSNSIYIYC